MSARQQNFGLTNYPIILGGGSASLAPFYQNNSNQESLGRDNTNISLNCSTTKLYTTDNSITVYLAQPSQGGFYKDLTYTYKGDNPNATVTVLNTTRGVWTTIVFQNKGDHAILIWNGNGWDVVKTMNILDTALQTPVVNQ